LHLAEAEVLKNRLSGLELCIHFESVFIFIGRLLRRSPLEFPHADLWQVVVDGEKVAEDPDIVALKLEQEDRVGDLPNLCARLQTVELDGWELLGPDGVDQKSLAILVDQVDIARIVPPENIDKLGVVLNRGANNLLGLLQEDNAELELLGFCQLEEERRLCALGDADEVVVLILEHWVHHCVLMFAQ